MNANQSARAGITHCTWKQIDQCRVKPLKMRVANKAHDGIDDGFVCSLGRGLAIGCRRGRGGRGFLGRTAEIRQDTAPRAARYEADALIDETYVEFGNIKLRNTEKSIGTKQRAGFGCWHEEMDGM
jgi:hypothetical protein